MTPAAQKIFEEALSLPDRERAMLVDALDASLDSPDDADLNPKWNAEIQRRIGAVERGEARLVPWNEVETRIRKRLGPG